MSIRFTLRDVLSLVFGLAFMLIGIDHFIHPSLYEPIVPEILQAARFWVLLSGFFEVTLGLLLIIPKTRSLASVGIASMLVALYWANFNMWYNDIPLNGVQFDNIWHVVRMLVQFVLILTIAWIGQIPPFKDKDEHIKSMSSDE